MSTGENEQGLQKITQTPAGPNTFALNKPSTNSDLTSKYF